MSLLTLPLCFSITFGIWLRFLCLAPTLSLSFSLQPLLLHHLPPATVPCMRQNWECCLPLTHTFLSAEGLFLQPDTPSSLQPQLQMPPQSPSWESSPSLCYFLSLSTRPSGPSSLCPLPLAGQLFYPSFPSILPGKQMVTE